MAEGPSRAGRACEVAAATSRTLRAASDNHMLLALYSLYKTAAWAMRRASGPGMMAALAVTAYTPFSRHYACA